MESKIEKRGKGVLGLERCVPRGLGDLYEIVHVTFFLTVGRVLCVHEKVRDRSGEKFGLVQVRKPS